jgi:hypothetical protein
MILGAGAALSVPHFPQSSQATSEQNNFNSIAQYTVLVYQEGEQVIAKDAIGNNISRGLSDVDCAKVIQSAIDYVKTKGGGIVHIKAGIYKINTRISIQSLTNTIIEGEGRDATILRANVAGTYIIQKDSLLVTSNLLIRDMTLDGNNISSFLLTLNGNSYDYILENLVFMRGKANGPQCYLVECHNLVIRNCSFENPASAGDLVAITGSMITVDGCFFTRTSIPGGGLTSGRLDECKIINCSWEDYNGYGAISLENFGSFDNILIMGNSFRNAREGSAILTVVDASPSGVSAGHTHNRISIIGNHLMNTGSIQLRKKTSNVVIQGNQLEGTAGIAITASTNCVISNNIIRNTNEYFPIIMYELDASNVIIHGNIIENSIKSAITLRATHNFHIKDNIITGPCTAQDDSCNAVHIQSYGGVNCDYGKITGNTVIATGTQKPKYLIYVEGNHIEVKDNRVRGYAQQAIGQGNGVDITVIDNQIL